MPNACRRSWLIAVINFSLIAACARTLDRPIEGRAKKTSASFVTSRSFDAAFRDFAVAADEPQAAGAGAEILAQGGNAADAAAATMLALGVSSFASSGLGGGGFLLYYDAASHTLTFLDFREFAPSAAKATMFKNALSRSSAKEFNSPSQYGGLAVAVPGEPAGIEALLDEFGSMPRADVVKPALRLAEEGFVVSKRIAVMSQPLARDLAKDPHARTLLGSDLKGFVAGSKLKRPELASTLRVFAKEGARPFYSGAIAKSVVATANKHGGVLTMKDLATYRVKKRTPLEKSVFGFRWVSAPPPSAGGYILLASLALLEHWAPQAQPSQAWWLHAFAESFKGPFIDRAAYIGDPDFVVVPLDALMSIQRIARRAKLFDPDRAVSPFRYALPLAKNSPQQADAKHGGGTSHFCVVDARGNVASVTTTINLPFGARITAEGMFLNNEMDDFANPSGEKNAFGLSASSVNYPGPHHRPVSSATPTIVFKGNQPVLCIGGVGGSRIVTAVLQTAYYALIAGNPAGSSVALPRIHHQGEPDILSHETFDASTLKELRGMGYTLESSEYGGSVQMIRISGYGTLHAVSDPRKGGKPAGR